MADLNLDLNYFDHPKTLRLGALLGKGSEVLPLKLWCYAGKYHAEDGRLSGHSTQELESLVRWWGKPGEAVEALIRVGFLEKANDGFKIHDWKVHQGHIHALKTRNKKVAINRWKKLKGVSVTVDTSGIPPDTSGVPQPTIPTDRPTKKKNKACEVPEDLKASETHILDWIAYKRERGQAYKPLGLNALWRTLRAISEADREEAIRGSMANNYAGIFPPKGGSNGGSSREKPVVGDAKPVPGKYANFGQRITIDGVARSVVVDPRPQEGAS